ncbi:unnamed protein product [Heligmosomoides polygyrus]|uniref:DUF4218 domain-containing protein n=1 Tax=Heligmosomoides polygyrus TaxID=6339 RepID=A0A183G586_HELPZ|nr:unnamed protein product [Heligmosomoides polygyrus]
METILEFLSKQIRVVLTLNFNGVVFRKLARCQAWPIYIRLEGLPCRMKNNASNMLIAGVMFLRKTPTETLLKELSVLKVELGVLEGGIGIESGTTVWKCFPVIKNGVIDFGDLNTIYMSPRWQSHQGCHLCVAPGEQCLIDHAIVQDLEYFGSPYHSSAAPFERMHRVLQIRHTQSATNCEELLLKNFLLSREFSYKMGVESPTTSNESFERLSSVMSHRGHVLRNPVSCSLSDNWYIPSNSEIGTLNLNDQHAAEIDEYLRRGYILRRSTNTRSDIVYLNANGVPVLGSVVLFACHPTIVIA